MPTHAESGFRHGWSTMPKLRVGMPPSKHKHAPLPYGRGSVVGG